jgi:hypothetical protein
VVDRHAAIQQHQRKIAVADGKHQIPSDRPEDHLGGELAAFESLIWPYLSCLSTSSHAKACNRPVRQHKDATEPVRY